MVKEIFPGQTERKISLAVDIQAKLAAGKGPGYERWEKVFNLKQMAATLAYLQDNELTEYGQLADKVTAVTDRFHTLSEQIKQTETAMKANIELKGAIVQYAKSRPVFEQYKATKYSWKFLAEHEAEMGHTDEIVTCDGNMPAYSVGKRVVRLDGHGIPEILEAVLEIFPLDPKTEKPVTLCDWDGPRQEIWDTYKNIILKSEEADKFQNGFNMLKDPEFMEKVRNAYCLVATSEKSLAANIILKKGLL